MIPKIIFLLISISSFGQPIKNFILTTGHKVSYTPPEFTAKNGEGRFTMTDIPNESVALYSYWNIPAKGDLTLLVFIHGWDGSGQYDPGEEVMEYLHDNDIGWLSVGMRGRNTGTSYAQVPVDVLKYRDAGAKEAYDVYATINNFLETVVDPGQINTDKITLYGTSGGGGTAYAVASKFPELANVVVDWFGMNKYGAYTGDPTYATHKGWAETNEYYRSGASPIDGWSDGVTGAVGYADYYSDGYSVGVGDAAYAARDHFRGMKKYLGKTHLYHYSADSYVSVDQSDYMDAKMTTDGNTHSFHRSTNPSLYNHGNFDLNPDYFNSITPYGLHWVTDAKTLTRQTLPTSGSIDYIAGYVYFSDVEIWSKRHRLNGPTIANYRINQGTHHPINLSSYNLSTDVYQFTGVSPTSTEPYQFVNLKRGSKELEFLLTSNDITTVNLKELNEQPLGYSHSCKLYYDLRNSDGYLLNQSSKITNIIDQSGNGYVAFNQIDASRKTISSGGLDDPFYYLKYHTGTLASGAVSLTLTGAFTIIVDVDATTIGLDKDILGGGSSVNWIEIFGNTYAGRLIWAIQTSAGQYANSNGSTGTTSNGTGRRVYCIRKTTGGQIHMSNLGADGYFNGGNRGTDAGTFNIQYIGGKSSTQTWDGRFLKLAVYDEDIGDTDAQAIMTNFYSN